MAVLSIVSRITPWKRWTIVRTALFLLLGIGTSLVSLLSYSPDQAQAFRFSPWLLPTICLVWIVVLLLTHVRNPPPLLFKKLVKNDHVPRSKNRNSTEYERGRDSQVEEGQCPTPYHGHGGYNNYNGA